MGALQERLWVLDVLPGVEAPRADLLPDFATVQWSEVISLAGLERSSPSVTRFTLKWSCVTLFRAIIPEKNAVLEKRLNGKLHLRS